MTIFDHVRAAFVTSIRLWRLLLILWAVNLAMALIATLPVLMTLSEAFGHSVMAQSFTDFVRGAQLIDLGRTLQDAGDTVTLGIPVAEVSMLLFQTLTIGGIMGRIDALHRGGDGHSTFAGFMADSGRFAWRSVRLQAWSLLLLVPLLLVLKAISAGITAYARQSLYESPVLWLQLIPLLVGAGMLVVIRATVDAARADMFLEERRQMWRSVRRGIQVVVRQPGQALVAYGVTGLVGLLLFLALVALRVTIPQSGWFGVGVAFLVGQAAVLVRLGAALATSAVSLQACRDSASSGVENASLPQWSPLAPL